MSRKFFIFNSCTRCIEHLHKTNYSTFFWFMSKLFWPIYFSAFFHRKFISFSRIHGIFCGLSRWGLGQLTLLLRLILTRHSVLLVFDYFKISIWFILKVFKYFLHFLKWYITFQLNCRIVCWSHLLKQNVMSYKDKWNDEICNNSHLEIYNFIEHLCSK